MRLRRDEALWAAFLPVFSDSTRYCGALGLASAVCVLTLVLRVIFFLTLPADAPFKDDHATLSPFFKDAPPAFLGTFFAVFFFAVFFLAVVFLAVVFLLAVFLVVFVFFLPAARAGVVLVAVFLRALIVAFFRVAMLVSLKNTSSRIDASQYKILIFFRRSGDYLPRSSGCGLREVVLCLLLHFNIKEVACRLTVCMKK